MHGAAEEVVDKSCAIIQAFIEALCYGDRGVLSKLMHSGIGATSAI